MHKIIGFYFFITLLITCSQNAIAQDPQVHSTIQITTCAPDYGTWKEKRITMQLKREHNDAAICSLLQPAAALGSVFFGTMAVLLTISVLSGGGHRDDARDLVRSIDAFIQLVKAPFTLQYEKNKAWDRIADLHDELAKRDVTQIS